VNKNLLLVRFNWQALMSGMINTGNTFEQCPTIFVVNQLNT